MYDMLPWWLGVRGVVDGFIEVDGPFSIALLIIPSHLSSWVGLNGFLKP